MLYPCVYMKGGVYFGWALLDITGLYSTVKAPNKALGRNVTKYPKAK